MKKKLAFFTKDLSVGGIQKSLINLLSNMDFDKYEIDLYLFCENNFYDNKLPSDINIYYLPYKSKFYKFIPFDIAKVLIKYNIKKKYDYAIDYNSYDVCSAVAAIKTNAKHKVMWIHNDVVKEQKDNFKYRILRFFFKEKYKYFDRFVGVSFGVINPFKKLNGLEKEKYYVIPNYIDTKEIINKSKQKVDLKVDNKKYNLVSIGRLEHQKGFDLLIDKFSSIIKKNSNYHLYIIGSGSLEEKLKKQVKNMNLDKCVTFLGSKNNPYKYMKLMDGFVIDSRYEGQGIVILEAKTLGLKLFVPEKLSPYIENISFSSDLVKDILKAKKENKKVDKLKEYNDEIAKRVYSLFI